MSRRSSLAASQNSMVSPSGVGRSKRTVLIASASSLLAGGRRPGASRLAGRVVVPRIDPQERIGHAATNLTLASTFRTN